MVRVGMGDLLLLAQGGFGVYEGMASPPLLQMLLAEAIERRSIAQESRVSEPDNEEFRGGSPERSFLSASGGEVQDAFYQSPDVLTTLKQLSGVRLASSGARGTYTYYCRAGDFLGLHRDIDKCDVAVITCLHDGPHASQESGALCLYPERLLEPLSAIRGAPREGRTLVRLAPGPSIVLLGGLVAHCLLPVVAGQDRVVSVLCFRIV